MAASGWTLYWIPMGAGRGKSMMGEGGEIHIGLHFTLMDNTSASLVTVLDVILVS